MLAVRDDRALVDAGTLIGAFELEQVIGIFAVVVISANHDGVRVHEFNGSGMLRQNHDARVTRSLVFHTGTDDRRLRYQQRYSLTLHVGAHQCAVRVVVFEERDHRGRN